MGIYLNNEYVQYFLTQFLVYCKFNGGFISRGPEVTTNSRLLLKKNLAILFFCQLSLESKVYDTCVLSVTTYGLQTLTLKKTCVEKPKVLQRAIKRAMLNLSLRAKLQMYFYGLWNSSGAGSGAYGGTINQDTKKDDRLETSSIEKKRRKIPRMMAWCHQILWRKRLASKMSQ